MIALGTSLTQTVGRGGEPVTYPAAVASALSGATVRQLSYWRSARSAEGPLLAPELHMPRTRVSYSFRDVVALRTFVFLRSRNVPLQRVRKAVRSLRELGEQKHLSAYRLVSMGKEVVWWPSETVAIDLTGQPAHQVIAEMLDILGRFRACGARSDPPGRTGTRTGRRSAACRDPVDKPRYAAPDRRS